jgi:hypothetical protein
MTAARRRMRTSEWQRLVCSHCAVQLCCAKTVRTERQKARFQEPSETVADSCTRMHSLKEQNRLGRRLQYRKRVHDWLVLVWM